jgi:hypothetical protein|tara:strand:+ start:322 stop:852 length:531 start_codon:yes stop_codon:yes gene_type:complete
MKYILITILLATGMDSLIIFDFNTKSKIQNWKIVDDRVMGGESLGTFTLSPEGNGIFKGHVSLENYGGFSSLRYRFDKLEVKKYSKIILKLKGDGKKYQFRIKDNSSNYYSYTTTFSTSGAWQEIKIPLEDFSPSFRGRKVDLPNFQNDQLEEIAFLIGNKKNEDFKLLIDKIELK